jgi:alpha-N-arabinofuranosidase
VVIGGCYVEGNYLKNAFRWKDTVGPWEERPGHFNDVWGYWTDDGFGFFEGLQVIFFLLYIEYKIFSL